MKLPFSVNPRKSKCLQVPKGMEYPRGEAVSFHAKIAGPSTQRYEATAPTYRRVPCYAALGMRYNRYRITHFPRLEPKLSEKEVFNVFQTLTEMGLVPEGTLIWSEGKKVFGEIPPNHSPHRTYVALCFFRWTDSRPAIFRIFSKILEEKPEISPFQALQYCLIKFTHHAPGHSFAWSYAGSSLNPLLGVAIKNYFSSNQKEERGMVCTAIHTATDRITPRRSSRGSPVWASAHSEIKYTVEKAADLLHPSLTVLYEKDVKTQKAAEKILSQLAKKGKRKE